MENKKHIFESSHQDSNHKNRSAKDSWKFRKLDAQIISELTAALVLFKMKTGNSGNYRVRNLRFDTNRKIIQQNSTRKSLEAWRESRIDSIWPVDIVWKIENIDIVSIRKYLFDLIEQGKDANDSPILKEAKEHFQNSINAFIESKFIDARKNLEITEQGEDTIHKKFRTYYTNKVYGDVLNASDYVNIYPKQQYTNKEQAYEEFLAKKVFLAQYQHDENEKRNRKLYRDIYLTLANLLYEKNHSYLDEDGQINSQWVRHMAQIFALTIDNIPVSWTSKSFYKIFHDGDFNFLREKNKKWWPVLGKLEHYVEVIKYLLDSHGFNAYAEWGPLWEEEWARSKKIFLNNLFSDATFEKKEKKVTVWERWDAHRRLSTIWESSVTSLNSHYWDPSHRLKSDHSTLQKMSSRTPKIEDESGLRMTYYATNYKDNQKSIEKDIATVTKKYFTELLSLDGISIKSASIDRKWDFVSAIGWDQLSHSLSEMLNISVKTRIKTTEKQITMEQIASKYLYLQDAKLSPQLENVYQIANGSVKRWANGNYTDVKVLLQYELSPSFFDKDDGKPIQLTQEISFYPYSNDFGLANHRILDLEKKIFNRVQTMNDPVLWKTISLHRLRYFTETALKQMSFDIDMYEDRIAKWELSLPENDDYRYMIVNWEKISLKWLLYRNASNDVIFDKLICHVLNMFLQTNKLWYISDINPEYTNVLVDTDMIKDPKIAKSTRLLTYSVLKTMALNTKHNHSFSSFYDTKKNRFDTVSLWELADVFFVAQTVKRK